MAVIGSQSRPSPRLTAMIRLGVCPACAQAIRHDLCAHGACTCLQCTKNDWLDSARRHLGDPPGRAGAESLLRADLQAMLALDAQRAARLIRKHAGPPRQPYPCACGRLLADGTPCMVTGALTCTRRYATRACKQYGYRAAKLAREAGPATAGPSPAYPPRWGPGEFERAWQAMLAQDARAGDPGQCSKSTS